MHERGIFNPIRQGIVSFGAIDGESISGIEVETGQSRHFITGSREIYFKMFGNGAFSLQQMAFLMGFQEGEQHQVVGNIVCEVYDANAVDVQTVVPNRVGPYVGVA